MKSKIILVSILLLTLIACTQKPFPKPENLAQKITNFVVANSKPSPCTFQESGATSTAKGYIYILRIYHKYDFYDVEVLIIPEKAKKFLTIQYYMTDINFDKLKTPADAAAELILNPHPKIFVNIFVTDDEMDMKVNVYQLYQKGNSYLRFGFTKEQIGLPEESGGPQKYLFHNGEVLQDKKWTKASAENIEKIQKEYRKHLVEIADYLEIEWDFAAVLREK